VVAKINKDTPFIIFSFLSTFLLIKYIIINKRVNTEDATIGPACHAFTPVDAEYISAITFK